MLTLEGVMAQTPHLCSVLLPAKSCPFVSPQTSGEVCTQEEAHTDPGF